MSNAIHTSDPRHFKRLWLSFGGSICGMRRTGEVRYDHPMFSRPVRANDRRHDVPAVLLSRLNQVATASDAALNIAAGMKKTSPFSPVPSL